MKKCEIVTLLALAVVGYLAYRKISASKKSTGAKTPVSEGEAKNFLNAAAGTAACPVGQTLQVSYYHDKDGNLVKKVSCVPVEVE